MNALYELIGESKFVTLKESETIADTPEYTVEFSKPIKWGPNKGLIKVAYHHKSTSTRAKEWVNSIAFAKIAYSDDYGETSTSIELHSNRTEQDERKFLETLAAIDYDEGYGSQELFGTIVFKDNTWLERGEYDGSEWWEHRKLPTEESLFGE